MFINIFINAKVPIRPGRARGGINQTFLYALGRECVKGMSYNIKASLEGNSFEVPPASQIDVI